MAIAKTEPIAPEPRATRKPAPGKKHYGNRRRGPSRGTHSGLRRGTLAWRKDPLIRQRIDLVWRLWAQGYSTAQMMPTVDQFCDRMGVPQVTERTVELDKQHIRELIAETEAGLKEQQVESLKLVMREGWRTWHDRATPAIVRSKLLDTISLTTERLAKLTGTMAPDRGGGPMTTVVAQKVEVVFVGADEWHRRILGIPDGAAEADGSSGRVLAEPVTVQADGVREADRQDDDGAHSHRRRARAPVGE